MINVQHTYINICINVPCEKALDTHTHTNKHIYISNATEMATWQRQLLCTHVKNS